MTDPAQLSKDELAMRRPVTVDEWTKAWKEFQAVCKKLHSLAERDGDLLKIDVNLKIGGKRREKRS
jgi:hypothetical protein